MKNYKSHFKKHLNILTKKDKDIKRLHQIHGPMDFTPEFEREPFESLVRAIAHQQLHGKAAETIMNRMLSLFPGKKFPTPDDLINTPAEKIRECGYSTRKVLSIKDIAVKTKEGIIPDKKTIEKMSNGEIIERLTQAYGVGVWTVQMLLIFQLGRLDVWPVLDFGVRNGYMLFFKKRKMPTPKQLEKLGEKWKPYQSIAALYFWAHANKEK